MDRAAAYAALIEPDPLRKVAMTRAAMAGPLDTAIAFHAESPGRPARPILVHPARVPQRGLGTRREMLVRWKGYGAEHDQWQRRSELLRSAPLKVAEYDAIGQGLPHSVTQLLLQKLQLRTLTTATVDAAA